MSALAHSADSLLRRILDNLGDRFARTGMTDSKGNKVVVCDNGTGVDREEPS